MSNEEKQEKKKKESKVIQKLKKVKHIEIIIAVVFLTVLLLIYFLGSSGNLFSGGNKKETSVNVDNSTYARQVEARLQQLLKNIKGVEEAEVMINFESTPEKIIAYIENHIKNSSMDSDGKYDENTTTSKTPIILNQAGSQLPLILKEIAPKVIGVMIVAGGVSDPRVKLEILNAVSILLDINSNKIAVLEKKK